MQIKSLDHINIRTENIEEMARWYTEVLGMVRGFRPKLNSDGVWMYIGDLPVVHLIHVSDKAGAGSEQPLKLEHAAFSATGRDAFEARLREMGLPFRRSDLKEVNVIQMNVWDPDGNHLHIDFPADESLSKP